MPPRRQPAPKSESKTGLVIALVFFVLTTIIAAAMAYVGFDGQEQYKKQAETAESDKKKAADEASVARAQLLANKIMMGTEQAPRAEDLGALRSNPTFGAEVKKISDTFVSVGVSWDPKTDAPPESVLVKMRKLQEERDTALSNEKSALAAAARDKKNYEDKAATEEAQRKQAETKQAEAQAAAAAAQKLEQEAKTFAINEITKLKNLQKETLTNAQNREAELSQNLKKKDEDIAGLKQATDKLRAGADAARQKIVATDRPHGKVTRIDNATNTAFIDMGTKDFVRPGMSFSILLKYDPSLFKVEDALPKKATINVVQVLGTNLSRATITYDPEVSPTKDPVEIGDQLYKPGWKPGTPVKWALVGHFDLGGLGRDDTTQLKTLLQKQGIVVDAYLDLNTLKIVGELHHGIDYLIVGNRPTGETALVIGDERKKAIEDAINGMVDKAQAMGITVMQHRLFLPIFGIDLPRQASRPHFPGGAGGAPGSTPTEEKPKEEKPKEEKKEENK